jgi:lipopolysaccharide assembly outer membrane protein LptD (OstA)
VMIEYGDTELRADHVIIYKSNSVAEASGSVRLKRSDLQWEGDRLVYNLETREMRTDRFAAAFPPYQVWAESGAKGTGITYTLNRATFTTCNEPLESVHYRLWARELTVVPDSYLSARHVVSFAGPVPVFYLPWMRRSLREDAIGVEIVPGYRSNMGSYLLTGFTYKFTNWFSATALIDYRSLRGFAEGAELDWKTPGGQGQLHAYFLDDKGVDDDENNYPTNRIPDSDRYRLRLRHREQFEEGWSLITEMNKLSDEFVREDFYRKDYRESTEPLNYMLIGQTKDETAMSLLGKWRMDDFYTTISRLPEARHEFFLTPILDSGYYYQGYNDAVYLRREPADYLNVDDTSVFRVDSRQFVSYPTSAGIFHFVPRAGVRATWFSKTRDEEVVERETTVTNTLADGTLVVTNAIDRTIRVTDGDAELRPLFEIGSEVSFKAFKEWASGEDAALVRYRHIAEPYANYTLRPDLMDQSPDDFYQFDEVDSFGAEHAVRLGMRNTIQFKRDRKLYELFDADVFSTYYFNSQEHEEGIGPLGLKVESRPSDMVYLRGDAEYDIQESELVSWNLRGQLIPHPMWKLGGEYRYRADQSSLVSSSVKYSPNLEWSFSARVRHNIDESRVEEHAYVVERVLDCMGIRFGFSHEPGYEMLSGQERDDDYNVHIELWLTAFPSARWGD